MNTYTKNRRINYGGFDSRNGAFYNSIFAPINLMNCDIQAG